MSESARPRSRRSVLRLLGASGIALAGLGALGSGIGRLAALARIGATRTRMGMPVTLTLLTRDPEDGRAHIDAAFREVDRLEGVFSRYRAGAALERLNRTGELVDPPPELVELLRKAHAWFELSAGAFDPTVTPLLELYRSRFERGDPPPSRSAVERTLALVGFRHVAISESRIGFDRPGMALTLDGLAKGYILDRVSRLLVDAGAENALVEAGGDFACAARGGADHDWILAVRDPRDMDAGLGRIRLDRGGLATSGDYADAYAPDLSSHHVIDPRTGASPTEAVSATVIAPSAADADALATTALVLGPRAGHALLERCPDVEGLIVTRQRELVTTRGYPRRTTSLSPTG